MGDVFLNARILAAKVAPGGEQLFGRALPGAVVLFSLFPPDQAICELIKLNWSGLRVVLTSLRQRLLIVPYLFCWPSAVKEKEISRNARVRRKDAIGQSDNGVQVKLFQ